MVSILASSAVDYEFQPVVKSQTIQLVFVDFLLSTSTKRKSKDGLNWNQDYVSE